MPYIKDYDREGIIRQTQNANASQIAKSDFICSVPGTTGELNYLLTRIIHAMLGSKICYDEINSMIGVLECCKLELYRKIAAPYEQKKLMENGPVSDLDSKSMEDVR